MRRLISSLLCMIIAIIFIHISKDYFSKPITLRDLERYELKQLLCIFLFIVIFLIGWIDVK